MLSGCPLSAGKAFQDQGEREPAGESCTNHQFRTVAGARGATVEG
jgi:hypothetical protein